MGVVSEVANLVHDATMKLPPGFIAMLGINVVFILGLLWFMHDLAITRIEAISKIFQTCTAALTELDKGHPH